jgi:hypothetical protein
MDVERTIEFILQQQAKAKLQGLIDALRRGRNGSHRKN